MAKHRQRVMISTNDDGTPVYQWVQDDSLNELNDRIVQAYIQSGRIWDFMQNPYAQEAEKPTILLKDYGELQLTMLLIHRPSDTCSRSLEDEV